MLKDDKNVLLNVRDLVIEFRNKGKKFQAVKSVNFDIYKQEILGLVGESGSGKTTIGRAIAGVQSLADGSIYLDDQLVAGNPTSLFKLNKQMYKKIKFIQAKFTANCSYINKIILDLENTYNKFKSKPELLNAASWRKIFVYTNIGLVHKLTRENLKFINDIIKDFKRINQFISGINSYIPEIPVKLEKSVLLKNQDTLDIVNKLKDKVSLDFFDLDELKKKIKNVTTKKRNLNTQLDEENSNPGQAKSVEEVQNEIQQREYELFIDLIEFAFKKLKLIKENDDRIKRRIKIAERLEEQNLDLSSPNNLREKLLNKYYQQIYVKTKSFIKQGQKNKINSDIIVSNNALKIIESTPEKVGEYIKDEALVEEFNNWIGKSALTEREIKSIVELIEYLKLPSIDELVKESYLFSKPSSKQVRLNRKNIQMIFQDPGSSLNERMSVEEVISEGLDNFPELYKSEEAKQEYVNYFNELNPNNKITKDQIEKDSDVKKHIILKLIRSVGLLPEHLSRYPHEFSGGQKQRIGIARSLALKPKIIIADEPISALDVSIRAQVLNLFSDFRKEYDLTYLFVTHDLSVVKFIADRIAVIYHGDIVEMAEAEELFKNPLHPYTRSLLSAIPQPDPDYHFDDKLIVYKPEEEHFDYIFDLPEFIEVKDNHFVLANKREIKNILKVIKK